MGKSFFSIDLMMRVAARNQAANADAAGIRRTSPDALFGNFSSRPVRRPAELGFVVQSDGPRLCCLRN